MRLYYDLHIHTALSPCADNTMTPNNIINMACLKGLNVIAITDHNSVLNLPPFFEINPAGIMIIPGVEVQSREEVHVLCYFKDLDRAMHFGMRLEERLPDISCSPFFGEQLIIDKHDNIIRNYSKLLLGSVDLSLHEVYKLARYYEGAVVPAHVDRPHFSIIANLGFVPDDIHFKSVELSQPENLLEYKKLFPENTLFLFSSDAHFLGDINEKTAYFDIKYSTIDYIIDYLLSS